MCGRFALHGNPEVIALQFGLGMVPAFTPGYNIAPSAGILIVRQDETIGRVADKYRWGLIPGWAKDPAIGNKMANARGESFANSASAGAGPKSKDTAYSAPSSTLFMSYVKSSGALEEMCENGAP